MRKRLLGLSDSCVGFHLGINTIFLTVIVHADLTLELKRVKSHGTRIKIFALLTCDEKKESRTQMKLYSLMLRFQNITHMYRYFDRHFKGIATNMSGLDVTMCVI